MTWVWVGYDRARCAICRHKLAYWNVHPTCSNCYFAATWHQEACNSFHDQQDSWDEWPEWSTQYKQKNSKWPKKKKVPKAQIPPVFPTPLRQQVKEESNE